MNFQKPSKGPYIYKIHEKYTIFAPPAPPPFSFLSEWVRIGQDPPPHTHTLAVETQDINHRTPLSTPSPLMIFLLHINYV